MALKKGKRQPKKEQIPVTLSILPKLCELGDCLASPCRSSRCITRKRDRLLSTTEIPTANNERDICRDLGASHVAEPRWGKEWPCRRATQQVDAADPNHRDGDQRRPSDRRSNRPEMRKDSQPASQPRGAARGEREGSIPTAHHSPSHQSITAHAVDPHPRSHRSGQRVADPPRGPLFFCVLFCFLARKGPDMAARRPVTPGLNRWCEHQTGKKRRNAGLDRLVQRPTTARRVRLQAAGPLRCRSGGLETIEKKRRLREREAAACICKLRSCCVP